MFRARLAALLSVLLITAGVPSGQTPASDTTAPEVTIVRPLEDATVSGIVDVDVVATDASGIAGVILEVDGVAVGAEDTTPPWTFAWDAPASGPGAHLLTVVVRDTPGNAMRSAVVPVVVGGVTLPPPPPPPVNHAPIALGDSLAAIADTPLTIAAASLLANDSDPDGHAITIVSVADGSSNGGVIVRSGSSWTYTPPAGFTGTDAFVYTIGDGVGGTASAPVSVTVSAAPEPPAFPAGLVLALGFDEASGTTAIDASGGNRNGTIRGAARATGKVGGALSFDGADDWVTVPDSAALDLTAGMSLSAWVRPTAMSGWETVILKERGAGLLSYAMYARDGAPSAGGLASPAGYVRAGGADQHVNGTASLPVSTWTHIATTYDGSTQRFYVNGALAASRPQTGPIAVGSGALRVGGNASFAGEFFQGLIDEVRVYNRALTDAEVGSDMGGTPPPPPPPVNRAPAAQNDSLTTTTGSAVPFTAAFLIANDSDPDGDAIAVTTVAGSSLAGGVISSTAAGSWSYAPPAGYSGADSFSYTIGDGRDGTASGTVNVTVTSPAPPSGGGGLVAAFGFNEGAGTTIGDVSGNGHVGTIRGAVFAEGKAGMALRFDGVDDWVTVPDSATLDLTAGMTLEAWIRPTAALGGWDTVLLKQRGTGDLSYALYANDGAPLAGGVAAPAGYVNAAGHQAVRGASALPVDAWTHVAATYDGATLRIYVNGALVASRAQTGTIAVSGAVLRIGGNGSFTGEFFEGLIDEVRIYNRALSQTEIQNDMNAPVQ